MCGIAGIYQLNGQALDLVKLRTMADTLRHRGPDDEGFALFNTQQALAYHFKGPDSPAGVLLPDVRTAQPPVPIDLGITERRLAILDLTPAGHTPMTTPDSTLTITFNGEIYNYIELRAELIGLGHVFKSSGDTEVLLAAYRQWDVDCVTHFNGMWAFALWDAAQRRLFCSRDRFGVKPFYYTLTPEYFAFASEPKALWHSGLITARPNQPLLRDFLAGYEASRLDETLFEGIQQLPGGHNLIVTRDGVRPARYWSLPVNADLGPADIAEGAVHQVRELLIDAVRLRLRSDVPVGTCLSGGLDSSAIVVLANDLMQHEHNIPRHLVGMHQRTFTACYDDPAVDERSYAKLIVDQTGAEWQQVFPSAETLQGDLEKFIWHHDEPPITTSMYAQWCVMRLVRQSGVTVTLDGQGADELLAGYLPFDVYLSQILRARQLGRFARQARAVASVGSRPLRGVLTRTLANQLPANLQQRAQAARRNRMLGLPPAAVAEATARHQQVFAAGSRTNLPLHLQALAQNNLPRLLRSEDRNSMAFSVEARTPFLDVRFAEYASQLPAVYRLNDGWTKYVLRRAVDSVLPAAITWRRDKKGFGTPEGRWLGMLRPRLNDLFHDRPRTGPLLDLPVVHATLSNDQFSTSAAASAAVWRWTAAELWLRMLET